MKIKMILTIAGCFLAMSTEVNAAMLAMCNDANLTQYICCPANGGWIVSPDCNSGASPYCANDTGLIAGSNPPISILGDCQKRGGTRLDYPM